MKMMKRNRFLVGGLLLVVLAALSVPLFRSGEPEAPPLRPRALEDSRVVREAGILEPRLIERILSPINGTLAFMVEDGARVKTGDLLFRLDEEEVQSRIEEQRENIEQRQEDIEVLMTELEILKSTYASVQAREQAELIHAELALEVRRQGLEPEARRLLDLQIELAQLELEDRRERLSRQQELVEREFAPASSLESLERDVETARLQLQERNTQRELELRPLSEEERISLQAAVDQARAVVDRSARRHRLELEGKEHEIEGVQIQLRHQMERLEDLEWELDQVRIHSPAEGLIRLVSRQNWRTRAWNTITVGQQVWSRDVLAELVDPREMTLRVLVHESDIMRLRSGLRARIRLTAYPEQVLEGKVLSLTALGQDRADLTPLHRQASPSQQANFLAEVSVEIGDVPAKPGMTAVVEIFPGEEQP